MPEVDPGALEGLTRKLEALRDAASSVKAVTTKNTLLELISSVEDQVSALQGGAAPVEETEGTAFGDFFAEMGKSLVQAQRRLDAESLRYVKEVSAAPELSPTVFRVPKLAGELKLGMRHEEKKGIQLFLFSNRRTAEAYQEQTLSFEMVGAPPPPEARAALEAAAPRVRFVLSSDLRRELFARVDACLEEDGGSLPGSTVDRHHAKSALGPAVDRDRVLVADIGVEGVLWLATLYLAKTGSGGGDEVPHLGAWRLDLSPTEGPSLDPVLRQWETQPRPSEHARLVEVLGALADKQQRLLRPPSNSDGH